MSDSEPLDINNLDLMPSDQRLNTNERFIPSENFSEHQEINSKISKKLKKPSPQKKNPNDHLSKGGKSKKSKKGSKYGSLKMKSEKKAFTYVVSQEILNMQDDATKEFEKYTIKHVNPDPEEYNDLLPPVIEKPAFFQRMFCCAKIPVAKTWSVDSDNFNLSGVFFLFFFLLNYFFKSTFKNFKIKQMNEIEEKAIKRRILNRYKKAPKLENLTIKFRTLFDFQDDIDLISKILSSSSRFDEIKQLRFSSLPSESLLWCAPRFVHDHFIMPNYLLVPILDPHVEIQNIFTRYIDRGSSKNHIVSLLSNIFKKFEKNIELQVFHIKLSSYLMIGDEVVNVVNEMLWKLGFNLRELSLHFCGNGLTDHAVFRTCDSLINFKCKKLIALSIGFDSRTKDITDHSLKKVAETILYLSEASYIRSISLCFISQAITDFGLWCLGQALAKVATRLNNLVLLFGAVTDITDKGVQDLINGVLRKGKNIKAISLGFFSSKLSKYGVKVIENAVVELEQLDSFNLYYSNKSMRDESREEKLKKLLLSKGRNLVSFDIQIYLKEDE